MKFYKFRNAYLPASTKEVYLSTIRNEPDTGIIKMFEQRTTKKKDRRGMIWQKKDIMLHWRKPIPPEIKELIKNHKDITDMILEEAQKELERTYDEIMKKVVEELIFGREG